VQTEEPPSLWNFGEIEPWRRGRNTLLLFASLTAIGQLLIAALLVVFDDYRLLLISGILWLLFWMQFYLVWIGWNWVRWLNALVLTSSGFIQLIWGMRGESGFHIVSGIYLIGMGAVLGLAPSIYAFARRQRERIGWREIVLTAAAFVLLIFTLMSALFGFYQLKLALEQDGAQFARTTFDRVFQDHDVAFLAKHASAIRKNSSPPDFMRRMESELGTLEFVDRPTGAFKWKLGHRGVELTGEVRWDTQFTSAGRVLVTLNLSGDITGWQIDHLGYN
jgi:hypothetical protein